MFVRSCKVRTNTPFDSDGKGIRLVVTKSERDAFLLGAEKVHATDDGRYDGFMTHVLNDWKEYHPSTEEEMEAFLDEQAYSLDLNEDELKDVVSFWFWLCSYFEDKTI